GGCLYCGAREAGAGALRESTRSTDWVLRLHEAALQQVEDSTSYHWIFRSKRFSRSPASSGSRPLSGSTRTIGEFASASPSAARLSDAARSRHCARDFNQKICAAILPALAAANKEPETIALASATPQSRSSRHRLRNVFGEHLTIRAISSWRRQAQPGGVPFRGSHQ